jgi:aminoglycoside phosphotransferase (APT) family kinase protein
MIPAAALAAVPGCGPGDPAPRIAPLSGGLVNRAYRIETWAGIFVLRLNAGAPQSRLLGVDRHGEIEAQRFAAGMGLAPRIIAVAPDHAFQVCEYVNGEVVTAARLAVRPDMARLGGTLLALRSLQPPPSLRGASLLERARRLVGLAQARVPADAGSLAASLAAAEAGWKAAGSGRACCLVHSDPNPGNVVLPPGGGAAVLLDWEYAHVGDPLQDPAAWIQASPALRGHEAELLRACGLESQADVAMLAGMVAVYEALDLAWSRLAETAAGVVPDGRAN